MVLLKALRLHLQIILLVSVRSTFVAIFFANANASAIEGSRWLRRRKLYSIRETLAAMKGIPRPYCW